jgi:PEGA domain
VTLTAEGQWFFGVGDEKNRIAKIFWNNMDAILKNGATSNGAPAPSPLVAQPTPALSPSAPSAPTPAPLVAPPASENAAMVQISSEPSGADILVDGNYTGSTPSQLKLKSGPHSVSIIKKGFAPWQRSITVESGEIRNVAAELEK